MCKFGLSLLINNYQVDLLLLLVSQIEITRNLLMIEASNAALYV